jgi:hypothetical protein
MKSVAKAVYYIISVVNNSAPADAFVWLDIKHYLISAACHIYSIQIHEVI